MADPPRDRQAAKRRASFARAERLRREAGQERPKKKDPARQAHSSAAFKKTLRANRDHILETVAKTPRQRERIKAMFDGYEQFIDRTDAAKARLKAHQRQTASKQESEQKRTEQKRQEDRAKDTRQRTAVQRGQAKRADDGRRAQAGKDRADKVERQRDQQRRTEIGRRQQLMRAAAQKAALDIDREHKRQREERQANDRRETSALRSRHRMERKSFQNNELAMLERHAGAIKRLEAAEQRELGELVGRQRGLVGRLAALKPGGAKKQEQERQALRDRHHAERVTKHRDLERFKERQFEAQQATRLLHARERLDLMRDHRDGRLQLERQQDAQRPMQVEQRRDAIVAVQAREQAREQPPKERPPVRDLSVVFERAR